MTSKLLSQFKEADTKVDVTKEISSKVLPSELKTGVYLAKIADAYLYVADSGSLQGIVLLDIYNESKEIITQIRQRYTLSTKDGKFNTEKGYPLVGLSNFLNLYSLTVKQVDSLLKTVLQPYTNNPNDATKETERFVELVGKSFYAGLVRTISANYKDPTKTFIEPELVRWFNSDKKSLFEVVANINTLETYNKFVTEYPETYVNDKTNGKLSGSSTFTELKEYAAPTNTFISEPASVSSASEEIPF